MSDSPFKFDWLDATKTVLTAVATAVVGVLVRLLFGRAMKGIDDSLGMLARANDALTRELKELRADLAEYRGDLRVLQAEVERLKTLPVPVGAPR